VLELASASFPALQSVKLCQMLVARADLGSLSACSQLARLDLHSCQLQQTSSTLSPLSAVYSLRQLSVLDTDSSIAAGLTQLTGLSLTCVHQQVAECLGPISGLTQLQHLELSSAGDGITAD
jgi:hypothetical protein